MLVVDASLVVAALVDGGREGEWASRQIEREPLAAPHLLMVEVANILARAARSRQISPESAELAHADLLELRVELFAYELVAKRAWELRSTVTAYDAWYVALAERLDAPLGTLDRKLSRASGPRCTFRLPLRSRT
jgi:predicted nucleic acid-binding protein